ncbi:hypothetical protein [Microlunatus sp. Y2014]|uniref:hypothetical protein n=1 Tax=Microlunatus sp. Y2014 TaxID=3418488 RepID=UPI003DA79ADA
MAKAKRRSLGERDAAAISGDFPFPAPDIPQRTATAESQPAAAAGPLRAAGVATTRKLGVYLSLAVFEDAKSAYLVDFDDVDGPDTFGGWVDAILARFSSLTPQERAAAAASLPEVDPGPATQRSWAVSDETIQAITAAISADRQTGRVTSRSQFAVDALRSAVAVATERRGGSLPPAPSRLPNRLTR